MTARALSALPLFASAYASDPTSGSIPWPSLTARGNPAAAFGVLAGEHASECEERVADPQRRVQLYRALSREHPFLIPAREAERVAELRVDDR